MGEPRKRKRMSWMQEHVLNEIPRDGKWHKIPVVATGSAIRGLVARGLIEHRPKNPAYAAWEWITMGLIRHKRPTKDTEP